jgi:hypothetical protein
LGIGLCIRQTIERFFHAPARNLGHVRPQFLLIHGNNRNFLFPFLFDSFHL